MVISACCTIHLHVNWSTCLAVEGPLSCVSSRFICVLCFIINVATRHIIYVYNNYISGSVNCRSGFVRFVWPGKGARLPIHYSSCLPHVVPTLIHYPYYQLWACCFRWVSCKYHSIALVPLLVQTVARHQHIHDMGYTHFMSSFVVGRVH